MRSIAKTMHWLVWAVILTLGVTILVGRINYRRQQRQDAQYAAEGQRIVEEFLKANDPTIPRQLGATNELGAFLRLEGSGFIYPVWNIQAYHFLDLHRTAHFVGGALPIRIIITEGKVTAPGRETIGKPKIENGMIFVSHPEVKPS